MTTSSVIIINLDEERYSTDSSAAFSKAESDAQLTDTYPVVYPEPYNTIGCGYGPLNEYVLKQCNIVASELGLDADYYIGSELMVTLYCGTKATYAKFVTMLGERLTDVHRWIENSSQLWSRITPVTDTSVNSKSVAAAEKAIDAHSNALNSIGGDPSIQVWHLLASLHEYCAANGVDFDAELNELRESILNDDLDLPASKSYLKEKADTEQRKKRQVPGLRP